MNQLSHLLVGVVANSKALTRQRVMRNMGVFSALQADDGLRTDWAIIVYDNLSVEWYDVRNFSASMGISLLLLEDGRKPSGFHPKLQYQSRFARLLDRSSHQAILLMDDDMRFNTPDALDTFLVKWACAWPEPPLVAQPVLDAENDNSSWMWLDRMSHWQKQSNQGSIRQASAPVAVETLIVQQAVVLLDAEFFQVLTQQVEPFARMQDEWSTDHGTDTVWCALARSMSASLLGDHRPSCVVIIAPVVHEDSRTITKGKDWFDRGSRFIHEVLLRSASAWFGDRVADWLQEAHAQLGTLYWENASPPTTDIQRRHACAHTMGSIRAKAAPLCRKPERTCVKQPAACNNASKADGHTVSVQYCHRHGEGRDDDTPRTPSVLIAHTTSAAVVSRFEKGITHLSQSGLRVGWAIVMYDGLEREVFAVFVRLRALKRWAAKAHNASVTLLSGMRMRNVKLPLQIQKPLVTLAAEYDYVWLADSDIDFSRFNIGRYIRYHRHAGAPLISQPLIRQNTQHRPFAVNLNQWETCRSERGMFVASTFVEQQVPLFESGFFQWLMRTESASFLSSYQQALPSDWGIDHMWCGAAMLYLARSRQQWRLPCAMIMVPIDHVTLADGGDSFPGRGNQLNRFGTYLNGTYLNRGMHMIALTFRVAGVDGELVQKYSSSDAIDSDCHPPGEPTCPQETEQRQIRSRPALPALTSFVSDELGSFIRGQMYMCTSHGVHRNNPWVTIFTNMKC